MILSNSIIPVHFSGTNAKHGLRCKACKMSIHHKCADSIGQQRCMGKLVSEQLRAACAGATSFVCLNPGCAFSCCIDRTHTRSLYCGGKSEARWCRVVNLGNCCCARTQTKPKHKSGLLCGCENTVTEYKFSYLTELITLIPTVLAAV